MGKKIKYIFFDLDHTLWDYENNSARILEEMYQFFGLDQCFSSSQAFMKVFHYENNLLWNKYNRGDIDREHIRRERFKKILKGRVESINGQALEMSDFFIEHCPNGSKLVDGAAEVLSTLSEEYPMSIITNGFTDTQGKKLNASKIQSYFEHVITSESAQSRKPAKEIFDIALNQANTEGDHSIMIGDNLNADAIGARNAGLHSVWFDPQGIRLPYPQYRISHLSELPELIQSIK